MKLLIITGAPATGKTTIFKDIIKKSRVLGFSKDNLKEVMFDSIGKVDLEFSKRLGIASYNLLFFLIETFAISNINLIVEANFRPKFDESKLKDIVSAHNIKVTQILCEASPEVVLERLKIRKRSGDRHENHFDEGRDDEFKKQIINGDYRLFDLRDASDITLNTDIFLEKEIENVINTAVRFLDQD